MKRYISLLLLPVMVFFSIVPASAAETGFSDPWIDILQFGGIVGQDSLTFAVNKSTHTLCEVQNDGVGVGYIELVFSAPNGISGLVVTDRNYPSLDQWWTVKALTSDFYVATCEYSSRMPDTFKFDFYYTGGAAYTFITLLSVCALAPYFTPGKLSGQTSLTVSGSDIKYGSFTDGNTSSTLSFTTSNGNSGSCNVYFTYDQWHGWDFIDFAVHLSNVASITSVNAFCNDVVIPVYYNTITNAYTPNWMSRFHLDLRKLPPSGTVTLQVGFRINGSDVSFYSWGATGTVDVNSVPLLSRWFKKLQVWIQQLGNSMTDGFDRLIDAIAPTSPSDPLPDSDNQSDAIKSGVDVITAVTKPTFNDSSFDVGDYTGNFAGYGGILSIPLSSSPTILSLFTAFFIFAMGAYALFGKR